MFFRQQDGECWIDSKINYSTSVQNNVATCHSVAHWCLFYQFLDIFVAQRAWKNRQYLSAEAVCAHLKLCRALFCDITPTQLFIQSSSPLKVSSVEITRIRKTDFQYANYFHGEKKSFLISNNETINEMIKSI